VTELARDANAVMEPRRSSSSSSPTEVRDEEVAQGLASVLEQLPEDGAGQGRGPMHRAVKYHGRTEHRKTRSTAQRRHDRLAEPHRQRRSHQRQLLAHGALLGSESIAHQVSESEPRYFGASSIRSSHKPALDLS